MHCIEDFQCVCFLIGIQSCVPFYGNLDGDFFFLQFASAIGCHFLWIVSSCFISKVLVKSSDMCSLTLLIFLFFFIKEGIYWNYKIFYHNIILDHRYYFFHDFNNSVNHLSPLRIWLMVVNLVFYTYCICPTKKLGLRQWPVSWHKRSAKERGWFGAENPWHAPLLHL